MLQGCLESAVQMCLSAVLEFELHLLDLKDPAGVQSFLRALHEVLEEAILGGDAVFDEVLEVAAVLADVVALGRGEPFRVEDALGVACVIAEAGEDGFAAVLASVLAVAALTASCPLLRPATALSLLILFHIHHTSTTSGRFFFAKVEGTTSVGFISANLLLYYSLARASSYSFRLFQPRKASVLAPSLECMAASRRVRTTCLRMCFLGARRGLQYFMKKWSKLMLQAVSLCEELWKQEWNRFTEEQSHCRAYLPKDQRCSAGRACALLLNYSQNMNSHNRDPNRFRVASSLSAQNTAISLFNSFTFLPQSPRMDSLTCNASTRADFSCAPSLSSCDRLPKKPVSSFWQAARRSWRESSSEQMKRAISRGY